MKTELKIEELTDEVLLAACRKQPWENRLENAGRGLALGLGLLSACGLYRLLGSTTWLFDLIAFAAVSITITVKLHALVNSRSRRQQAELRRRYALEDFEEEAKQAEGRRSSQNTPGHAAPDWQLILQGRGLPHGDVIRIGISLRQADPPEGSLSVRTVSDFNFQRAEPFVAKEGEAALSPEECTRLLELLTDLVAPQPDYVSTPVIDGFPCDLAAVRRVPPLVLRQSCNLAGVEPSSASHPAPELMQQMLDFSKPVIRSQMHAALRPPRPGSGE